MRDTTARDLCVPLSRYPHAHPDQTLADAVRLLRDAQIEIAGHLSMPRVLLVVDDDARLVGIVRRRDILRGLEPRFHDALAASHPEAHVAADVDPNLADLVANQDRGHVLRRLNRPLSTVIRELPGRVDADDSLMRVVRELVGNDTHMAAVTEDDAVIGVVRTLDVLQAVTDSLV